MYDSLELDFCQMPLYWLCLLALLANSFNVLRIYFAEVCLFAFLTRTECLSKSIRSQTLKTGQAVTTPSYQINMFISTEL